MENRTELLILSLKKSSQFPDLFGPIKTPASYLIRLHSYEYLCCPFSYVFLWVFLLPNFGCISISHLPTLASPPMEHKSCHIFMQEVSSHKSSYKSMYLPLKSSYKSQYVSSSEIFLFFCIFLLCYQVGERISK